MAKAKNKATLNAVSTRLFKESRKRSPDGKRIGPVPSRKKLRLTFQFAPAKDWNEILEVMQQVMRGARPPLSHSELEQLMQANPADIKNFRALSRQHALKVLRRTRHHRVAGLVRIEGTQSQIRNIIPNFAVDIYKNKTTGAKHLGRHGAFRVVTAVPTSCTYIGGADDRDVAHSRARFIPFNGKKQLNAFPAVTSRGLALMKGIPVDDLLTQRERRVVNLFISLGGAVGANARPDIKAACEHDGVPMPRWKVVPIDGAPLDGDLKDGATVENLLDFLAHFAFSDLVGVLYARNDDDSFAMAIEAPATLVFKIGKVEYAIGCVTISWGGPESQNTKQSLMRWARALVTNRLRGISIMCAATGDDGSKDKTSKNVIDQPSGIHYMMGISGVRFISADGKTITGIAPWDDTGGGISDVFEALPTEKKWGFKHADSGAQNHPNALFAEEADPESGPIVFYKGKPGRVGGTSHASPFAGAELSLINCLLKNPVLDWYNFIEEHFDEGMFDRITVAGSNGAYSQEPGDKRGIVCGYGVLNFKRTLELARHYQDGVELPKWEPNSIILSVPAYQQLLASARARWRGDIVDAQTSARRFVDQILKSTNPPILRAKRGEKLNPL